LALTKQAIRDYPHPDSHRAGLHNRAARILLAQGEAAQALEYGETARDEGKSHWDGPEGLLWGGLAEIRLGRIDAAVRTGKDLKAIVDRLSGPKGQRFYHLLAGEWALAQGDTDRAIAELEQGQSTLPPRGFDRLDFHVPIWSALASAHLAAGDEGSAAEWLRKITESRYEHLYAPVLYVRSFYRLAKIHENWEARRKIRQLGGA
jgi:ATP/maltotriose-dependent transcriptional regulator MalT